MDTKSQIIEISRKLFAEHGFDGVSVRTICGKVGCNVSAISYYFGSKEELFQATVMAGAEARIKSAELILTAPESPEDLKAKLKIFLNQFFDNSSGNSCLVRIISRDMNIIAGNANVQAYFKKIPEIIERFFASAQESGIVSKDFDPQVLVDCVLSPYFMRVLFSDVNTVVDINDPEVRHHLVDQHIELICRGILV